VQPELTAIVKREKTTIDASGKVAGLIVTHYAAAVDARGHVTHWVADRDHAVAITEVHAKLIAEHYARRKNAGRITFEDEDGDQIGPAIESGEIVVPPERQPSLVAESERQLARMLGLAITVNREQLAAAAVKALKYEKPVGNVAESDAQLAKLLEGAKACNFASLPDGMRIQPLLPEYIAITLGSKDVTALAESGEMSVPMSVNDHPLTVVVRTEDSGKTALRPVLGTTQIVTSGEIERLMDGQRVEYPATHGFPTLVLLPKDAKE